MNRKKILNEVEELIENYCKDCFLFKFHKEEKGRRYAHRFCISKCTVGEKIKNCGEKLS
ncbi:zinc-finger domain-containing protein [Bacillus sp. 03113]|uniref:zinc-finger domain-containing protein n=1 Tax=Bacillus sp. 03113 TaxID=2578211 RepID=UPI0011444988|nr:zinc-finger domain-containing protein [Bacillus sp. 03113]